MCKKQMDSSCCNYNKKSQCSQCGYRAEKYELIGLQLGGCLSVNKYIKKCCYKGIFSFFLCIPLLDTCLVISTIVILIVISSV